MLIPRNDGGIMRFFCKESTNKSLGEKSTISLFSDSHMLKPLISPGVCLFQKKKKNNFHSLAQCFVLVFGVGPSETHPS